jgi:hypothetical protein
MQKLYRQAFLLLTILSMGASALAQRPANKLDPKREQKLKTKKSFGLIKQSVIAQNQTAIPGWHEIKTLESLTKQQKTSLMTLYRPYKQRLRSLKEQLRVVIDEERAGTRSNAIPTKDNKNPNITVGEAILLGSLEPEEANGSAKASSTTREQASNAEVKSIFERMIATKKDAWNHLQPLLTRAQVQEVTTTATARMRSRSAKKPQPDSKSEQESLD